jgi:hypothetical protein
MLQDDERRSTSRDLAARIYDDWVRRRQERPGFKVVKSREELGKLGLRNFDTQLASPRKQHLEQLRALGSELAPPDKVALLVALELPVVEASTLMHKLSMQLARDAKAIYFSELNQSDNCGCGCGCGCASLAELPYLERINAHRVAKPFSIDPFNESGLSEKDREELLIRDFIASYEALSTRVTERVNQRYFDMGRSFG